MRLAAAGVRFARGRRLPQVAAHVNRARLASREKKLPTRAARTFSCQDVLDLPRLTELYQRFAPLVHARARRVLGSGSDADDVVQEVFMRLMQAPPAHDELGPWLYRTSTNLCLDRVRHGARRDEDWERDVAAAVSAAGPRPVDELIGTHELCRKLLARVAPRVQAVVVLTTFDELSRDEVAELLGISRKTVTADLEQFHTTATKVIKRWQT